MSTQINPGVKPQVNIKKTLDQPGEHCSKNQTKLVSRQEGNWNERFDTKVQLLAFDKKKENAAFNHKSVIKSVKHGGQSIIINETMNSDL